VLVKGEDAQRHGPGPRVCRGRADLHIEAVGALQEERLARRDAPLLVDGHVGAEELGDVLNTEAFPAGSGLVRFRLTCRKGPSVRFQKDLQNEMSAFMMMSAMRCALSSGFSANLPDWYRLVTVCETESGAPFSHRMLYEARPKPTIWKMWNNDDTY